MTIWSALRTQVVWQRSKAILNAGSKRNMSGHDRTFPLQPTRWQWTKFKDYFHFYVIVGLIPVGAIITLSNIFVGPATLSEIPEGYIPKYWEYYRHPITRFIARYIRSDPQQEYEKLLHVCFEEDERIRIRKLETEIKQKMQERQDYQAYYYRPVTAKYHKITRAVAEKIERTTGE